MTQLYNKPVHELMRDFVNEKGIKKNEIIKKGDILIWFADKYPDVKKITIDAHIMWMTTNDPSRVHHKPNLDGRHDLFFRLEDKTLRLYDKENDPTPIYKKGDEINGSQLTDEYHGSNEEVTPQEFAFERDLLNFLSKNLHTVEPGLVLYNSDGITGIEFNAGGRFIDILAVDKNNCFVVIELKVSKGSDRVIGQLLRYIGWIKSNLAKENQKVRGIIIARNISEDLKIASSVLQDVKLFEYNISFTLSPV